MNKKRPFERILRGRDYGDCLDEGYYVIKDDKTWEKDWKALHGHLENVPDLPKIDFEKEMVIVVAMDECDTIVVPMEEYPVQENDVDIISVSEGKKNINITVRVILPDRHMKVRQMVSNHPYDSIKMAKTDKNIAVTFNYVSDPSVAHK